VGPAGPAAASDYGYVYNGGAQFVPIEADVTFDSNGILSGGISHAPGTSQVVVSTAGTYSVEFIVSAVEPNQFAVFVNGAAAPGALYGSGSGIQQTAGHLVLTLAAGDVLTLRNHSSAAAVTLQTLAGGTQTNVNASILIERLPDPSFPI
jgi:hypothetical protein